MGQGNQKCFNLCAGKVGSQRENPLQNGSTLNQAAGAGLAFLIALLVLQNLLAVLKLPDSVLLCGLCGGCLRLFLRPVFPRLDTVILPLLFKVSRPVLP